MSILVDGVSTHVAAPSSTFQGVRKCCLCYTVHHRDALYTVISVLETCGLDFCFSGFFFFLFLFVLLCFLVVVVVFPQSTNLYKSIYIENTFTLCTWG